MTDTKQKDQQEGRKESRQQEQKKKNTEKTLSTLLNNLGSKDLADTLITLPKNRLMTLIPKLFGALNLEQLKYLSEQIQEAIEQIENPEKGVYAKYGISIKNISGKHYAYVRSRDKTFEKSAGRVLFLPGRTYLAQDSKQKLYLRCLDIYIDLSLDSDTIQDQPRCNTDIEYLSDDLEVTAQKTYELLELKKKFQNWTIEEIVINKTNQESTMPCDILVPAGFHDRILGTLEQWSGIVDGITGVESFVLQRRHANETIRLITADNSELIIYKYNEGVLQLSVHPQQFLSLLEDAMIAARAQKKGASRRLAERVITKIVSIQKDDEVLKILFDL